MATSEQPTPTPSLMARLCAEYCSARVLFPDKCKTPRQMFEEMLKNYFIGEGDLTDGQFIRWALKTVPDPGNDVLEALFTAIEGAVEPYAEEYADWQEIEAKAQEREMML